jgi:chitodextrinase
MRKTILQLYCMLSLLLLGPAHLFAQARYWVGGTSGNWNDPLKWSTVSGGAGGAGAPMTAQDALFDANSFTAPGGVVVVTAGATCRRMNWTGVTNGPVLSLSNPLTIYGNGNALVWADGMSVVGASDLIFKGSGNITVNMGTTGKTVGALKFTANAPKNITLVTGDGPHTHTFGVITMGNNSTLNVTGIRPAFTRACQRVAMRNSSCRAPAASRVTY